MDKSGYDIIVVGGGVAGLTATAALGVLGFKVLCLESTEFRSQTKNSAQDIRSTAFLRGSVDLLKEIGIWESVVGESHELKTMCIADCGGVDGAIRQQINFNSSEVSLPDFGYNVPNAVAKRALVDRIDSLKNCKLLFGLEVINAVTQIDKVFLILSDNNFVSAKLVVAADGSRSKVRELTGVKTFTNENNQYAIACVVSHEKPHDGTSVELLKSGGPCTLVPMKSVKGKKNRSAVVWMETKKLAYQLVSSSVERFSSEISKRTDYVFGECTLISQRSLYPITTQIARKFYAHRTALIAEAAHVMPPIGAQGLNTSLEDIIILKDLLTHALATGADIGSDSLLKKYNRNRQKTLIPRVTGIHLLNNASKSNFQPVKDLRMNALKWLDNSKTARQFLIKTGLGKPFF
ncbi:MAG: FAD-dependent monooxygenase [Pseudomonadota bacterium]|nr:FAD-dependent monooxygenase [Pseudomonadota bacterium]